MLASLRKVLFWSHLAVGVTAGAVIFIMSVTGVLLTYQKQIVAMADRSMRVSVPAEAQRVPVAGLLASVATTVPGAKPASLTVRANPDAPVGVSLGRGRTLYLDPYSGASLGEGSTGVRDAFRMITDAHRWLAMKDASRDTARKVTGAANLGFLLLVLSGIFLWIPRAWTWTQVRAVLLLRRGLRGKARDFNWHHVAGFWMALPLVLVVASGVVISYPWASALVYKAVGEKPPAPAGGGERRPEGAGAGAVRAGDTAQSAPSVPSTDAPSLDALLARAQLHADSVAPEWRTINLPVPDGTGKRVSIAIDEGNGGQPQLRRTLVLDRTTGEVISTESFATQSTGRRLRSFLRFAHTGEVGGIPGQTLAGLASLAGALLVWTGIALSLRRLAARIRRGRKLTA